MGILCRVPTRKERVGFSSSFYHHLTTTALQLGEKLASVADKILKTLQESLGISELQMETAEKSIEGCMPVISENACILHKQLQASQSIDLEEFIMCEGLIDAFKVLKRK